MRWLASFVLVVAACYHPSAATGVPCGGGDACPWGQRCDTGQAPPVCVAHLTDAAPLADTPISADAPAACATSADCGSAAPVCDGGACRRCVADAECASGVCTEYTGACVDEPEAAFVAATGADTGTCPRLAPCATLSYALGQISATRDVIAVGPGTYSAPGAEVIAINGPRNGNVTAVVVSGPSEDPSQVMLTNAGGSASPEVVFIGSQTSSVVLEGMTVVGAGEGIHLDAPATLSRIWVEHAGGVGVTSSPLMMGTGMGSAAMPSLHVWDSRIEGSTGLGINAQANGVEVLRSVIVENAGGGIQTQRGALSIASSIISANGTSTGAVGAIHMVNSNGQTGSLAFDTIADNQAGSAYDPGITADDAVTLIDTIYADNGSDALCATCSATYSLFLPDVTAPPGVGNLAGDPAFVNEMSRDYHILPASSAHDMGHPAPPVDYDVDGQPRPQGAYDIGADEIP